MVNKKFYQKLKKSVTYANGLFVFFCFLGFTFDPSKAFADFISNGNYSIDVSNIDTNPQPSPPKKEVLGINNTKFNYFTTGPNYAVASSNDSLSLIVPQNIIDYGILSSTNPVIRTSTISINDNYGAEVLSYENYPLTSNTKDVIENTSCDNGECTPEIPAVWTDALTYGFGYRCDSEQKNVCDSQFTPSNYFKPFADNSKDDTPEFIMLTNKGNYQATLTYKVTISGTQKSGGYNNSITYLAVPEF